MSNPSGTPEPSFASIPAFTATESPKTEGAEPSAERRPSFAQRAAEAVSSAVSSIVSIIPASIGAIERDHPVTGDESENVVQSRRMSWGVSSHTDVGVAEKKKEERKQEETEGEEK